MSDDYEFNIAENEKEENLKAELSEGIIQQ